MLVCFSGFKGSGKTTAASVFAEELGFRKIAFADKLRDMLYALNPIIDYGSPGQGLSTEPTYLQDIIDLYGWDGYKQTRYGPEIRRLIQRMGTEAGRGVLGENIWIDSTLSQYDGRDTVIHDGRFYNEFDAVRDFGGMVIRIENPNITPDLSHSSESEAVDYPHFDCVLQNDGTEEEFLFKVRSLALSLQ